MTSGAHEAAPYVVTELLEGETLRSELAGERIATRRAVDYGLQIARGLEAAREKGIVHRDLKSWMAAARGNRCGIRLPGAAERSER
jgi:serine/threonine protein kinase